MRSIIAPEVYSPAEIAQAAGVPIERVVAALGRSCAFVAHEKAVRLGRALSTPVVSGRSPWCNAIVAPRTARRPAGKARRPSVSRTSERELFSVVAGHSPVARSRSVSVALSSAVHAGLVLTAALLTSLTLAPTATALRIDEPPYEPMRLVFLAEPGPAGGGGGGGQLQPAPAAKALRQGRARNSSPVPVRRPPRRIAPMVRPPEPELPPQPLRSEPLPVLVAPIVSAPADSRDRIGVLENTLTEMDRHGPGEGGGAGTGVGTGLGSGSGPGVGPGSDGGTGGGPFRPGSGIEAPRLLREVKADYAEDARRRGLEGEVVLEIVVTRSGAVGDVRFLRRLGAGLDERAAEAVRQWRFAPATRKGLPVDVIVEVGVEFRIR
ncbi:MAG: hypothetical protein A3H97_12330 [Acidobacteria bacterium RIFCSPLOWO2_02_FULL_65_29]|nr:MAG: hypothetical protein A3H97_12330 [Acidobacteria bacterium RIFCSPLOWO2_02_FULL_65_29]